MEFLPHSPTQCFPIPDAGTPCPACCRCLCSNTPDSNKGLVIWLCRRLITSVSFESGVLEQRHIDNMQGRGSPGKHGSRAPNSTPLSEYKYTPALQFIFVFNLPPFLRSVYRCASPTPNRDTYFHHPHPARKGCCFIFYHAGFTSPTGNPNLKALMYLTHSNNINLVEI